MLILSFPNHLSCFLFISWWIWLVCQPFNRTDASPLPKILQTGNSDVKQGEVVNLPVREKQLEDEEVRELQSLKPSVDKDGGSAGGYQQSMMMMMMNAKQRNPTMTTIGYPEKSLLTQIELPQKETSGSQMIDHQLHQPKNINEEISSGNNNNKWKSVFHRGGLAGFGRQDETSSMDDRNAKNAVIPYTPLEMAEYIYETGDEKTVTLAVEHFLQNGIFDREEAIYYLQDIKSALNALQQQSVEEQERKDKKDLRSPYDKVFEYPRSRSEVKEALSDLKEIQKLLQSKYIKSFPSTDDIGDEPYGGYHRERDDEEIDAENNSDNNEGKIRLTEKDYQSLIEKLQLFENLFSEASMEEVIYELAKVLFSQSFTMGGAEAQDALKQFTSFLETQVEEGHISRNMERKVLDILISALADVLNEHPELVNANHQKPDETDHQQQQQQQLEQRKIKLNRFELENKNGLPTPNNGGKYTKSDTPKKVSSMRYSTLADSLNVANHREHMK